jgi:hypothetical protein
MGIISDQEKLIRWHYNWANSVTVGGICTLDYISVLEVVPRAILLTKQQPCQVYFMRGSRCKLYLD